MRNLNAKLKFVVGCLLVMSLMVSSGCVPSIATIFKRNYEAEKNAKSCAFDMNIKITFPEEAMPPDNPFGNVFTMKGEGMTSLGDENVKDLKMQMSFTLFDTVTMQEIMIDGKLYIKMLGKWYEIPEEMLSEAPMQKNPLETLLIKEEDFKELKKEDDATVNGIECYEITAVPTQEFMEKVFTDYFNQADMTDPKFKSDIETILASMEMEYTVFIDKEEFLTRRALVEISFELPGIEGKVIQEVEMIMKDYGIELNIKAPEDVELFPSLTPQSS